MNWKTIVLILGFLLLTSTATGFERVAIQDIDPDNPELQEEDLRVSVIIFDNKTEDFHANMTFTWPNGSTVKIGTDQGTLKADIEQTLVFDVDKEKIDQFGNYTFTANDTLNVVSDTAEYTISRNSIDTMSVQLGTILALILTAFLFMYAGFQLNPRNKIVAVLRVFLVMLAPLFAVFAVFTAAFFAGEAGFGAVNAYMNIVFLATFIAAFVILFVLGLVLYMTDAFKAAGVDNRQFPEEV